MGLLDIVPAGVVTGQNLLKLFEYAREHNFAIPAINCTSTRYKYMQRHARSSLFAHMLMFLI